MKKNATHAVSVEKKRIQDGPILEFAKHPFTLVIFGASGSLAKLKLFPALYELQKEGRMPKDFCIVGYGRTAMTDAAFRRQFAAAVRKQESEVDQKSLDALLECVFYCTGGYDSREDFLALKQRFPEYETTKRRVRMAYFSVPPSVFPPILEGLAQVDWGTPLSPLRLIIEKPFGYDLDSAKRLKKVLDSHFKSEQVFLLDHYLGKEAVSNLLSLRYANSILTDLLQREFVSNVQITAMEEKDIEGRANYFDQVGIVRDMLQSHLLQVLAYFAMFAPLEKTGEAIHQEKARVLRSIFVKDLHDSLVRGQYKGYTKEQGIPADSQTETYVALRVFLKHPLWKGVPFYIRSGKSLRRKWTGIVIEFKARRAQRATPGLPPNRLVIQIQPYEKIEFHLLTKLGAKTFDFHDLTTGRPIYCSGDCLTEHGRLLLDVIAGKQGLFLNFEEIFAAWKVIDPLQKSCDRQRHKHCELHPYLKGTDGPAAADALLKRDGFTWFNVKL